MVKLEKLADVLIADHVKRGGAAPPPGSYSWRWIEFSIKNGFLQPRDDYRIEGAPAQAGGTAAPPRGKRVPFTKDDDEILTKFVMDHERQGSSTGGNVIFKELKDRVSSPPSIRVTPTWLLIALSIRNRIIHGSPGRIDGSSIFRNGRVQICLKNPHSQKPELEIFLAATPAQLISSPSRSWGQRKMLHHLEPRLRRRFRHQQRRHQKPSLQHSE